MRSKVFKNRNSQYKGTNSINIIIWQSQNVSLDLHFFMVKFKNIIKFSNIMQKNSFLAIKLIHRLITLSISKLIVIEQQQTQKCDNVTNIDNNDNLVTVNGVSYRVKFARFVFSKTCHKAG